MLKILNIVGARFNFMKIAPIFVHNGQHYDRMMSDSFLTISEFPHRIMSWKSARIITAFAPVDLRENPDQVVDVNSTIGRFRGF